MKKQFFLFALTLISSFRLSAQYNTIEYLDINNVKAGFLVHGEMFGNPVTQFSSYEFPKGSGLHSNDITSLWIGGYDQSTNNLKVAAQTYRQNGNDFWPGPLDEFNGATIDSVTSANWAQIWKVNLSTIDSFILQSTHTLSNTNKSILEWPGRANPYSKTPSNGNLSIPNRDMAPFVDVNNDNVYNPMDGDYPDIKGEQMLFWVFNDKANAKTNSGSSSLSLEIHGTAYACTRSGLNNTIFVNLKVIYWGTSILDSVHMGLFSKAELGYPFDDYVGYDSTYKMMVLYNGDNFDEGTRGYGSSLTQTGIVMLEGPKVNNPNFPSSSTNPYITLPPSRFTYFNNSAAKDGNPTTAVEFYNYLTGSWKDGSAVMRGCNPTSITGTPGNFVFPDDPSVLSGISEKTCNNIPFDRRMLTSSGPFQLVPGIVPSNIKFAIINTDTGVNNSNFNELRRLADSATVYANGCGQPMQTLNVPNITMGNIQVYPNPASTNFTIEDTDQQEKIILLYNAVGQLVYEKETKMQKVKINTAELADGIYFLKVEKDKNVFSQSILIR